MSGRSDDTNPAGTLSAPQGWTEFTDVHGRHFLRQVADNGDLLIAFRPTPIEEDWKARAEQAEAKLDRLREPHTRGPRTNTCNDCGQDWPCETIQTIDEEKPHA